MHKRSCFRKPLCSELVNGSQNLQKSTFTLLFRRYETNWFRKCLFLPDLRHLDCLLTRWLSTTSILVIIGWIYHYQLKCNYLKNQKYFAIFYCTFGIYIKFWTFSKKNQPPSLSIFEVTDFERRAYLNA